jgi:hypothetical protein
MKDWGLMLELTSCMFAEPALTYEATLATLDEIREENLAQIELGERFEARR